MGEITRANIKAIPIESPTKAIAFVRIFGRVRSAKKAVTTDEIAPIPCTSLAIINSVVFVDTAAKKLPNENKSKPATITLLRPKNQIVFRKESEK